MEVRDKANNSKIARRFVIYDNVSKITVNPEETGKLYVSSANPLSDYKWQTEKNGKQHVVRILFNNMSLNLSLVHIHVR